MEFALVSANSQAFTAFTSCQITCQIAWLVKWEKGTVSRVSLEH